MIIFLRSEIDNNLFKMSFLKFELDGLAEAFPKKPANLENDFDDEELAAIDDIGVLKGNPHIYLGEMSN